MLSKAYNTVTGGFRTYNAILDKPIKAAAQKISTMSPLKQAFACAAAGAVSMAGVLGAIGLAGMGDSLATNLVVIPSTIALWLASYRLSTNFTDEINMVGKEDLSPEEAYWEKKRADGTPQGMRNGWSNLAGMVAAISVFFAAGGFGGDNDVEKAMEQGIDVSAPANVQSLTPTVS